MYSKILGMKKLIFSGLLVLVLLFSCNDADKVAAEVAKIPMNLKITRFDKEFAAATPESLPQLRNKYYFPEQSTPRIFTVTNDVDYNNRIILADTVLLIGLDNYLGATHKYYGGFQRYVAKNLDRTYMTSDVVSSFAKKVVPRPRDRTFLARMIYFGKELYLKDKLTV